MSRELPGPRRAAAIRLAAFVLSAVTVAGCSGGSGGAGSSTGSGGAGSSTRSTGAATTSPGGSLTAAQRTAVARGATEADTDASGVEWLCRPGQASDPCREDLTATVVPASGPRRTETTSLPANPPIDCFYVYPTVSGQSTVLADLHIDPAEVAVAGSQAARFSSVCRVYAPVYPQVTVYALLHLGQLHPGDLVTAFEGVLNAWNDYLDRYNHGRGVVVIGHSQGAAMLTALLRYAVDDRPTVLNRLVSAIILGGNVTVPVGATVGGSFAHIPACTSSTETHCVVAYSSFAQPPPAGSFFGRPGLGASLLLPVPPGRSAPPTTGMEVLCVNPAAPGGGGAALQPYFPSSRAGAGEASQGSEGRQTATAWVTYPGLYTGRCQDADGASWLQVSAPVTPGDPRPVVGQTLGPLWGLHPVDVNIALGNLVSLVASESAAYRR